MWGTDILSLVILQNKMMNFLKWGQGPRPDLLLEELERRQNGQEQPGRKPESGPKKPKADDIHSKDRLAMVIAMLELLLPWIAGGVLIFFLFLFLLTRL